MRCKPAARTESATSDRETPRSTKDGAPGCGRPFALVTPKAGRRLALQRGYAWRRSHHVRPPLIKSAPPAKMPNGTLICSGTAVTVRLKSVNRFSNPLALLSQSTTPQVAFGFSSLKPTPGLPGLRRNNPKLRGNETCSAERSRTRPNPHLAEFLLAPRRRRTSPARRARRMPPRPLTRPTP